MSTDSHLESLLSQTPHKAEALAWLELQDDKERTIGESSEDMDTAESLRFVKQLYQSGAVQVTAIDIEADEYVETTSTLIVELPEEALSRKNVLKMEARLARKNGFDAATDEGQKYIMLQW